MISLEGGHYNEPPKRRYIITKSLQDLKEKYGYKSTMAVPKLEKIVINMGVGDATSVIARLLEAAVNDLSKNIRTKTSCYKS